MPDQPTSTLYFAYGSNLNLADFARYCEENGSERASLRYYGKAWLPDHELAFSRYAASRGGGVLDVRPRTGQLAPGVLFTIDAPALAVLDEKEGAPFAYERYHVTVLGEHGQHLTALTYHVLPDRADSHVTPSDDYLKIVRDGYRDWQMPEAPLLAAAANRPLACPDTFFVYGTLLRDERRYPILERFGVLEARLATTAGRLISLGPYPGLIDLHDPSHRVRGDFVRLQDPLAALDELDAVEGFEGFGRPGALYERVWIRVRFEDSNADERWAWSYRYARRGHGSADVPSGDWRAHLGRTPRTS